jgi:hypothetical protein
MFGGSPMMTSPAFMPSMPVQSYPAPRYDYPPMNRPAPPPRWQQPAPSQQALAQPTTPRAPIFRAKAEDEPLPEAPPVVEERRPEPLSLPSPEQLGVGHGPSVDWADVHRRLEQLGALSFQQQKRLEGGFRITFMLPTDHNDRTQQIEAVAETEAQAVRLALEKAEELAGKK